jgi:hypothetical protein
MTDAMTFTRIYGTTSDTTNHVYMPLPYTSVAALTGNVEILVDDTSVNVTVGATVPATFDETYIILEYLKQ